MAEGSQVGRVQAIGDLTGLAVDIFKGKVKNHVKAVSPASQLFKEADAGPDYKLEGQYLKGAAQLSYAGGGVATGGSLPDHEYRDATQWRTRAVRRYVRRAIDNLEELRVAGEGAFDDLSAQIFDQQWDTFARMEIRHAIGNSNGYVGLCSSRTSSTVFVIKDAYGHTGTNPGTMLEVGMALAWLDASSANAAEGAGRISAITYGDATCTVTMDSASTWEPGDQLAVGDAIVFATTGNISTDYFDTEYTKAPHGLMGIIDPDNTFTTVLNIAESGNPRWEPFREASSTFDHLEVTEHWRKLGQKGHSPVTAQSHVSIAHPVQVSELARTLAAFQQQQQLGRTFEGGYQAVRIAGRDIVEDGYTLHDVFMTVCVEDIFRANLGGEADVAMPDGKERQRLADFDGSEWYIADYMQTWSDRRNRHGALTSIAVDASLTPGDYDPSPNQ